MQTLYRELGLLIYRWATGRSRTTLRETFASERMFPALVVFYHRVAIHSMNSWSIEQRNFERHLDWIVANAVPVSLDCIRESQMSGKREKPMVAVTFDDGYSENCEYAIPALIQRRIPCTYFVTTHNVETGTPFRHDSDRGVPLRPNTVDEIRNMAKMGIDIGAHSHTHVNFGQHLSDDELRREIPDVRKRLQDWTGQPIDYFAFPFGLKRNISQEAIDKVFESGFKCFVSAAGGMNYPGQCANHLQRFHGDPGMASFKNWLTYDPRKFRAKNPIETAFRIPISQQAFE